MHTLAPERTIRTHANIVHLAGDRAYKLKRPVKYPFLDYSTLELRRHFIFEELRLNRRFSPEIYLGVVEILNDSFPMMTGELLQEPRENPAARDYALVMRRIPEDCWLPDLVRLGRLERSHLDALIDLLVRAWRDHPADDATQASGLPDQLRRNTVANISECERFVPQLLSRAAWRGLDRLLRAWFEANPALFVSRVQNDRIRDGHGDLKPGNVAFLNGAPVVTDCIEFNPLFRRLDTLAEAAFLATGLESLGAFGAAVQVLEAYRARAQDDFPQALRRYYQAHLACVMGKVTALQLDDPRMDAGQRERATELSRAHFGLAGFHAREPHVLLVGGIMGCGKSTLARALSEVTGWPTFSSDVVRKELWGIAPTERLPRNAYTDESALRVYAALAAKVDGTGGGVILDAQWPSPDLRAIALRATQKAGGKATMILCDAADEVVRARMDQREKSPNRVSDATSDLLANARARFVVPEVSEGLDLLRVDTTDVAEQNAQAVMRYLVRPC